MSAPPPSPASATRVVLIACAATFLAFLDVTVVNIAFPDIERDFAGTSLSVLSWVVTAYAIVFAAALAPAGRLGGPPRSGAGREAALPRGFHAFRPRLRCERPRPICRGADRDTGRAGH